MTISRSTDERSGFRLIHVSDTHLSRTHRYFEVNWSCFREAMSASPPHILIHGGDLAFNGPSESHDLVYAVEEIAALGLPWHAIPGNHDIGEAPDYSRLNQPINRERIDAWRGHVGAQWWHCDVPHWRLIGLDTALMGSNLPEEAEQGEFLQHALAARGALHAMVFVHMPPFERDHLSAANPTSYIPLRARATFLDVCASAGVKVIACGHKHVYRKHRHRGMDIVWAPATAMVDIKNPLARRGTFPRPGYLEWVLGPRGASHTLVEPERMFAIDMTGWTRRNGGTTTTLPAWP
ncbi:MAG: metallophosphoesterase [Bradyrhizobium sp.]